MGNERVKDVGDEMHGRGLFGVIAGKCQPKLQDGIGVVTLPRERLLASLEGYGWIRWGLTLVNKESAIPNKRVVGEWNDVHPEWAVRLVSQRSIFEGEGGTRYGPRADRWRRSRGRSTSGLFRKSGSCTGAQ